MKHFLITRFNIKSPNWQQTKSGALTNSKAWLEQRFRLFDEFCLPSVKNQTNQNFKWYVVFDIETPIDFKNQIINLERCYKNLIPLYTKNFYTLKSTLTQAILSEINAEDEFIITTRLDNDDAIHSGFINCIQQVYIPKHNTIIDLIKGYQLIANQNKYDARYYTSYFNPFISLIEATKHFETVMAKNHEHWKTLSNRIIYTEQPLWIQVVHSDNLLNSKIKMLKKTSTLDFRSFGLKHIKPKNSHLKSYAFNLVNEPFRFFIETKNMVKRFLKSKINN